MKTMILLEVAMMLLMAAIPAFSADLSAGDEAPDFEMIGSDGKTYKLSEIDTAAVVAWYPKAFTGG